MNGCSFSGTSRTGGCRSSAGFGLDRTWGIGDEIDIDLKEEPDFFEKSMFKDGRLDFRIGDGGEMGMGREILGKVKDLRADEGVAGALTEVGKGIGEAVIVCERCSKGGWLWSAIIRGATGVSFVVENTKEGDLEDEDGVTRDSAEEDNGGEGLRANIFLLLSTSGSDTSEAEVSSWSDGESGEAMSGGEFMLSDESEAWAYIV